MLKIMFAAMASDSGKTSVTCGMLALLARRGLDPCAFKCGPDYIDPMFHRSVIGVPSHNIDLYMCSKDLARQMFNRYSAGHGAAVVEGVMGYYDGLSGTSIKASACDVAETMGLPVFLVVRPKGTALTLAAQIKGMVEFRKPTHIRGIILNDSSEMYCKQMSGVIESQTGVPVIGYIPHVEGAEFKSRHLGLYTAGEIDDLTARISKLADAMEQGINIDRLISLSTDEDDPVPPAVPQNKAEHAPIIAVAKDEAFNFIYEETIDTLRDHGAQIRYFSPVHDQAVPQGASGIYIPGGYPELYCAELEKNSSMRESIKTSILSGMPVVAECGGFLYLGKRLADRDGVFHDMAGVLPGEAKDSGHLARFGYAELSPVKDNMLLKQGETVSVHEFHYWDSTENGHDLVAGKSLTGRKWECGFARDTIYAGFPHLYMAGYPFMAERFVEAARRYMERGI